MVEKIGILGGTFNPVHLGHLMMAQDAAEAFDLTGVLFVPCSIPPHKEALGVAPARDRIEMLRLAVRDDPRFDVEPLEIERGGVSYSVDTLRALKAKRPDADFHFVIGGDTLTELHTWREIEELLGLCRMVTMVRPGYDPTPEAASLRLPDPWPARLLKDVFGGHLVDVSSTDIRERAAQGRSIRYMTPREVELYIVNHELYRANPEPERTHT